MLKSLWNGATGMNAQMLKMDIISNNLANVSTTGFKKNQANFQDLVYRAINQIGNPVTRGGEDNNPLQTGVGVRLASSEKIFNQGNIMETNRPLDLAIEGKGFFGIFLDSGEVVYTRDGTFHINEEGDLVSSAGKLEVEPQFKIAEDHKEITISTKGEVTALNTKGEKEELGRVLIYKFNNSAGLETIGDNLFKVTEASGEPIGGNANEDGLGLLRQGFLETSNISIAEELSQLIETQRAYQLNSRSIKTSDEMWSMANNIKK